MYCEYNQNDLIQLLGRFASQSHPVANSIVDSFGVVTPVACVPHLAHLAGQVMSSPPYPDDSIRSKFIEYIPLVESIAAARGPVFRMMELGASYAPFTCLSGVIAKRQDFTDIRLLACEAAPRGIAHLRQNLKVNGLLDDPRVRVDVIQGAVARRSGHVYFPDVDSTEDNGGNIKGVWHKLASLGKPRPLARIKAYSLRHLLEIDQDGGPVDFVHCDIQGAEHSVLSSCMPLLGKRVRRIFVATHSRQIEHRLFKLFDGHGWQLAAEESCEFRYRSIGNSTELRLFADGGQYWRNRLLT